MSRTKVPGKKGPSVVRLVSSNPVLTYDQCRDQDFEAVPQFLDHEQALNRTFYCL
jgi:hypothetical protein